MAANQKSLTIHHVYLKDITFEAPNSPNVFTGDGQPKVDFNMALGARVLSPENNLYEIELQITVKSTLGTGDSAPIVFQMELAHAGSFVIKGYSEGEIQNLLSTTCAGMVFPFAREVIASTAIKAGFPNLIIPPVDFELMHQQASDAQKK